MPDEPLSQTQLLADRLSRTPDDHDSRFELARMLVARGQRDLAHRLLETVPPEAPARLRALRDQVRATPARLTGVAAAKQGPPWRWSGCLTSLAAAGVFVLFIVTLSLPFWAPYLSLLGEQRRTVRLLSDPSASVRLEAAARLAGLYDPERPEEVGAAIGAALSPTGLTESQALTALSILHDWELDDAEPDFLDHESVTVKRRAADHLRVRNYAGKKTDALVRAALDDDVVAVKLIDLIARARRDKDVDALVALYEGGPPAVRAETASAVVRSIYGRPSPDPRLVEIAAGALRSKNTSTRIHAIEIGLKHGDEPALEEFLDDLEKQAPLSVREAKGEARRLRAYGVELLESLFSRRKNTNSERVLEYAIELKKRNH